MTPANPIRIIWLVYLTLAVSLPVYAHHSPSQVVEALSKRIESGKPTATLFVRRGDEYRAIAEPRHAAADYQSALSLQPDYLPALHGLAHARFRQQHFDEAIQVSQQGIAASSNADEAGPFHAIRARTYEQQELWQSALTEWKQSLAASQPNINWYLGESRTLTKLNRPDDARLSLEAAIKRNPSVVLHRAWIRTLIDCGMSGEASQHIEAGIARSRWKSSWLLLRAQLELSEGQPVAAQRDAKLMLQEIDTRWNPTSANPFLAANRDQALAILERSSGLEKSSK